MDIQGQTISQSHHRTRPVSGGKAVAKRKSRSPCIKSCVIVAPLTGLDAIWRDGWGGDDKCLREVARGQRYPTGREQRRIAQAGGRCEAEGRRVRAPREGAGGRGKSSRGGSFSAIAALRAAGNARPRREGVMFFRCPLDGQSMGVIAVAGFNGRRYAARA